MFTHSLQSCPTLCYPVDCSLPGSTVHGIFQARVLEWAAIAFSILRSITPLQCLVNVNYRVLICCTCLFQSGTLVYFGSLCLQISSVPNFCPDRRGQKAVTCLGSLVHLCSGEGGTLQTKYHWRVWGVLAVYGPHCVCPRSRRCVLPRSTLLRLQGALQGHCPKQACVSCTSQV